MWQVAMMVCSEVTRAMPRLRTSCGSPFQIMCRSFELRARLRVCAWVFTHVILREASHYRMFMKCPKRMPSRHPSRGARESIT
jgi:hypothetical protein